MKTLPLTFAALLSLAACAETALPITQKPVEFARLRGADNIAVVSRDPVVFRSYARTADGKKAEVAGAQCLARVTGMQASFITPVTVNLPRTRGKAGPMSVSCQRNGATHEGTLPERLPVSGAVISSSTHPGAGLIATLIVAGVAHGVAQERDIWAYMPGNSTYSATLE